jgi:SAM-dependent methyltransferase
VIVLDDVDDEDVVVEFPMGGIWRAQTRCARFVRLRHAIDGRSHALVRAPASAPRGTATRTIYAPTDPPGERRGLGGAGVLAYTTGDQLHPPMVDREDLWSDGARWHEAAVAHTLEAALFAGVKAGERILDIGCGVGGPARTLVDRFEVSVVCATIEERMARTAARVNERRETWRRRIQVLLHDCQRPFPETGFDLGWSMNMLYQVPDHEAMLAAAREALRPGGRLMLEDWVVTDSIEADELAQLRHHFGSPTATPNFARAGHLDRAIVDAGMSIAARQDLTPIGRTHLARYGRREVERWMRPQLQADFPNEGAAWADLFADAVALTGELYQRGSLEYRRILAVRD